MHYIKHIGISLLLLAVPAAVLAEGDTTSATDKTYWETVKETPGNYPKSTVLAAVAVTAAGVYAAHTYSTWFREKVSGPVLEKFEAYRKNLKDGDTKTLAITGATVVAFSAGVYGAHEKWDLLGKLKITTPKAQKQAAAAEATLIETIKRLHQLERRLLQQCRQDQPIEQLDQLEEQCVQVWQQIYDQTQMLEQLNQPISIQFEQQFEQLCQQCVQVWQQICSQSQGRGQRGIAYFQQIAQRDRQFQ